MDKEDEVGAPVELHVYDLTKGMAKVMSQMLIGRQLEGIWHTSIVAFGREYFFGSAGIQSCRPGGTVLGDADKVEVVGETFIPYQVFLEYILGLGETTFGIGTYDLFKHNCNNFSNEVSLFLCGKGIPKYILDLPEEILSTPIAQTLRPLIDSLNEGARGLTIAPQINGNYEPRREREESPEFLELNSAIDEIRRNSVALEERRNVINEKLAKKERKKKKKKREKGRESEGSSSAELTPDSCSNSTTPPDSISRMAENEAAEVIELTANGEEETKVSDMEAKLAEQEQEEKKEREERKKQREPPIVYRDAVDVQAEFDALVGLIDGILSPEEQQSLEELHQYMLEDEGSWALGDGFLNFVGRLLHDKSLQPDVRVRILNVLAAAALKDDVILLLHQDRREHVLMNYAHDVDRLSIEEQEALALFICNMFENLSSSEWLLYISEWQYCNTTISNIRCTTKVAVNSLLADSAVLQERGTAIVHNLACKEVFDDVAVELTMALLQYFNSNPKEEHLFRCMKALNRFCEISQQDVPQLIQMIGPEPAKFRGVSERVDDLILQITVPKTKAAIRWVKERFPILKWMPLYTKMDSVGDFVAGITLGLTLMPQSIAYASLAGLSPQYGLYSAFMGSYIYVFFGTIKEVSIGPTALMSLLTYEFTQNLTANHVVLMTFLAGCVELTMGLVNLGVVINFISAPVISGFTSATSVIIIVSQIKSLLGLKKFKHDNFVENVQQLIAHLHECRLWDSLLGISAIIFLLSLRKLKDVGFKAGEDGRLSKRQEKIKKLLWMISISRNAVTVVLCSCLAYWFEVQSASPFILSGTIEPGVPPFRLPPFSVSRGNETTTFIEMCADLGSAIIVVPVVAVLANVAIAKAFSTGQSLQATQEMLALGLCNIFGSCVSSMPICGAFTRSAVSNASGVRTPLVGIYSGTLILLALTLLTPYFYYIPRTTLAAVLISAVMFMIDWQIIKPLWTSSKQDLFLVVVTFTSCLMFGVEMGLFVGVLTNVTFLLYLWARPSITVETYTSESREEFVMITPDLGLMYPSVDVLWHAMNAASKHSLPVVINCTYIRTMDYTTATALKTLFGNFKKDNNHSLIVMNVKTDVLLLLKKMEVTIDYCCNNQGEVLLFLHDGAGEMGRCETVPVLLKEQLLHEKECLLLCDAARLENKDATVP